MLRKSSDSTRSAPKGGVVRYSRGEMLQLREAPWSVVRPNYLSNDFNNDEGKFSPEKWLEYRWICEGVENRTNSNVKRKEKLKVEALEADSTVLSPQRRAFSSGCRAASPVNNEAETERCGVNKASWRAGAGFQPKNSGSEYKSSHKNLMGSSEASFIRTRVQNGSLPSSTCSWRTSDTLFKPNYQKEIGQNQRVRVRSVGGTAEEKMPEWLSDGPTSMHDMIELRGFDDDNKIRTDFFQAPEKESAKAVQRDEIPNRSDRNEVMSSEKQNESAKWITVPTDGNDLGLLSANKLHNRSGDNDVSTSLSQQPFASVDNGNSISSLPLLNGKLPNSDAEFAAIMGILGDADLDSLKENELKSPAANEPTGSRLSRFFASSLKPNNTASLCTNRNEFSQQNFDIPSSSLVYDHSPAAASVSVLNKIFSNNSQRPLHSPYLHETHVAPSVQGVLRVEDLERNLQKESLYQCPTFGNIDGIGNMTNNEQLLPKSPQSYSSLQMTKGNPLGDPHQQAHLMRKLNKFARMQDGICDDILRLTENNLALPIKISSAPAHQLPAVPLNSQTASHSLSPTISDVTLRAAFLRAQYEKAAALQALAANQRTSLSQSSHENNVLRHALTNMMASGAIQQAQPRPVGNAANSGQVRTPLTANLPNAFMPTSVMRQMTKNTCVSVDEKLRHPSVPTSSTQYNAVKSTVIQEHHSVPPKVTGDTVMGGLTSKNAADLMTRLALQQQYAQMLAAMQNGLPINNWQPNAQIAAVVRSQTLAAQAEQQRQFALAVMRGDLNQAQLIRARLLSQQAAFASLPNVPIAPPRIAAPFVPIQPVVTTTAPVPQNTQPPPTSAPYKYQNPLEKLLQSAGVPANRGMQPPKEPIQATSSDLQQYENLQPKYHYRRTVHRTTSDLPSIISRLPPTANCISVEELEKQFATN